MQNNEKQLNSNLILTTHDLGIPALEQMLNVQISSQLVRVAKTDETAIVLLGKFKKDTPRRMYVLRNAVDDRGNKLLIADKFGIKYDCTRRIAGLEILKTAVRCLEQIQGPQPT